jgi:hypothetical protein
MQLSGIITFIGQVECQNQLVPAFAAAYDQEKSRCQSLHPGDSHAYGDCKESMDQED